MSNEHHSFKAKLRIRLFKVYGWKENNVWYSHCFYCEEILNKKTATIEHLVPRSKGGTWNINNLRLSCSDCNNKRNNSDWKEFKRSKYILCRIRINRIKNKN